MGKNTPFNIFVLAVFIGLIAPLAIQDGMFMDGQIYASVSHNLANGYGSFWFPTFSKYFLSEYSEQLPLFFWIQGAFFKLLGNSLYTERIFCFIMAIITAWNISLIWKLIYREDSQLKSMTWLPVFYWIMIPVISWSYIHNVEEVLMSVFATASVYFALKGIITNKNLVLNILISGAFVFLTSFCKGIQGLFPLVTIAFYWLFYKNITFKKALGYSLIIALVPIVVYGLLLWNDTSYQSIENYFNNRLVRTFTKSYSATTDSHFSLLKQIFEQLIPVFIILLLSFAIVKTKVKTSIYSFQWKPFGFFLSLGLAGSLPLMVTLEQRGFYLTTSLPFTALALAGIGASFLTPWLNQIDANYKGLHRFKIISIISLIGVLILTALSYGKTKRNEDELHDMYAIGNYISKDSDITIPRSMSGYYSLRAYFSRYYHINLDVDTTNIHEYYLTVKKSQVIIPSGFEKSNLKLLKYDFYEK